MIWGHNLLIISTINLISFVICLQIFTYGENDFFDSSAYGQTLTNASDLIYQTSNSSFNAEGTINTILFLQDVSNTTKPIVKDINTNYGQTLTNASDLIYQTSNSSFNAEGTINTILFLQDVSNTTKPIVKDINTNSSSKYILGGKWRIDVLKDNLTYFKSNFTMIEVDGRGIHFHTIVYRPVSNESVDHDIKDRLGILYKSKNGNSSGFKCNVDIYTNGVLEWKDVPITVSLVNEKVIMMDINDKISSEHFLKNPLYGLMNSIDLVQK